MCEREQRKTLLTAAIRVIAFKQLDPTATWSPALPIPLVLSTLIPLCSSAVCFSHPLALPLQFSSATTQWQCWQKPCTEQLPLGMGALLPVLHFPAALKLQKLETWLKHTLRMPAVWGAPSRQHFNKPYYVSKAY